MPDQDCQYYGHQVGSRYLIEDEENAKAWIQSDMYLPVNKTK